MDARSFLVDLDAQLPRHARLLRALIDLVAGDDRLRWLDVGCSLAAGRGDALSDIDAGVGYDGDASVEPAQLADRIARTIGTPIECITHHLAGWADDTRRVAAQYPDGVQLDLVVLPAADSRGLPDAGVALVDKDGHLARSYVPDVRQATADQAREWTVLGWWALTNVCKYLARGALFEAVAQLAEARAHTLRLHATANHVPYPLFGLTSLLDVDPPMLPDGLADAHALPTDAAAIRDAAQRCAALLAAASAGAGGVLGIDLRSALGDDVRRRLAQI